MSCREQLSRREVFKLGLGAALLPCGCPKPSFADGGGGPYWDYSQDTGPGKWGGVCALGRNQSPVDLPVIKTVTSKLDFRMDYSRTAKISVINTAHGNFNVSTFAPRCAKCQLLIALVRGVHLHQLHTRGL